MTRSRLLVLATAAAAAGVLVRRYLEEQDLGPASVPAPGSTTNASHGNGGDPSTPRAKLYAEAQRLGVKGRSKMNKAELGAAVAAARAAQD